MRSFSAVTRERFSIYSLRLVVMWLKASPSSSASSFECTSSLKSSSPPLMRLAPSVSSARGWASRCENL